VNSKTNEKIFEAQGEFKGKIKGRNFQSKRESIEEMERERKDPIKMKRKYLKEI